MGQSIAEIEAAVQAEQMAKLLEKRTAEVAAEKETIHKLQRCVATSADKSQCNLHISPVANTLSGQATLLKKHAAELAAKKEAMCKLQQCVSIFEAPLLLEPSAFSGGLPPSELCVANHLPGAEHCRGCSREAHHL